MKFGFPAAAPRGAHPSITASHSQGRSTERLDSRFALQPALCSGRAGLLPVQTAHTRQETLTTTIYGRRRTSPLGRCLSPALTRFIRGQGTLRCKSCHPEACYRFDSPCHRVANTRIANKHNTMTALRSLGELSLTNSIIQHAVATIASMHKTTNLHLLDVTSTTPRILCCRALYDLLNSIATRFAPPGCRQALCVLVMHE